MKEKLISIMVITLFLILSVSSIAYAEKQTTPSEELHIASFGSSLLIGIRRVGFVMSNTGENTLHDVSWTFTVTRSETNEIIFTDQDTVEEFTPDLSTIFSVHLPNDVGYLDLTATATCSELESETSDTLTVFQLGPFCIGRTFLFSTPY
jgi:hypothetical protein